MHSVNLFCHEVAVAVSFVACIVGLMLLCNNKQQKDDVEETELILFRMSFAYWLVYCVAFGVEKLVLPDWETVITTLKITTALSYFLTFSCILSLPLHKFAVHRVEE
ncbi:hypothetical protein FNW02_15730 [Komarekiella sp. 'clone 1']|uniref:Uncharacterized protein n=1 Tax=Komarekiella delphini-convector SJRDD-AB1 TaxID=2593771 RepID=A0AA40SXP7_9NOST|nr:hypothetical protein [Komarekiella delphini-convector]MBD6617238.1 hypothetical protein [Komarekiella delphini-convector SJRDD-AB1]